MTAAPPLPPAPPASERLLLVTAGGRLFALPLAGCHEILEARPYTPLPGSAPYVLGLVNVRGRIATVIDLGARLGLAPAAESPLHSVVMLEYGGRRVGLAVEEVVRIDTGTPALAGTDEALPAVRLGAPLDTTPGAPGDAAARADDTVCAHLDAGTLFRGVFA